MLRKFFLSMGWIISGALLVTCDNYEFPPTPSPHIATLPVVDISTNGATFQAEVTYLGDEPIINHGFIWGENGFLYIDSDDNVQAGPVSTEGVFTISVDFDFSSDVTYNVVAFVATENYLVYGNMVSFVSE